MHKLDHIVLAANTLEEGTSYIENKLRIKLSNIGYHKDMGTHNRVVKISKSVYLEVISIDPNCEQIKSKRWFNLDSSKLQSIMNLFLKPREANINGSLLCHAIILRFQQINLIRMGLYPV